MDDNLTPAEWVQEFNKQFDNIINTWREIEVEDRERLWVYRFGWWLYDTAFTISRLLSAPILAIIWGVWDAIKDGWKEFGDD